MRKLSPTVHYRYNIYWVNSSATVLEEWSRVPFTPEKRRCRVLGAPSCRKTKTHPGISSMAVVSGQEDCHDSSLCLIHFDTRLDKWISVLPSFETLTCIMYKFSTFVLNKVMRWDEWGEVGNVYMV